MVLSASPPLLAEAPTARVLERDVSVNVVSVRFLSRLPNGSSPSRLKSTSLAGVPGVRKSPDSPRQHQGKQIQRLKLRVLPFSALTRHGPCASPHYALGCVSSARRFGVGVYPCLYIPRFSQLLEFGDKNHDVSMTALRLVQRMKRDWMHTGRRPSGLCGAALLVAARMYDFRRTIKEIVDVVKVCETTLRKRLNEFEDTPTSSMTIEEFMREDLDQECDPPCFTAGLRKKKNHGLEVELKKQLEDDVQDEIHEFEDEIDAELENSRPKLRGIYAAYTREVPVKNVQEALFVASKDQDEEEEDELQAVAKHFGKDLDELTMEALRRLERPLEAGEEQIIPHRNAPSLESILGPLRSAATLGLGQTISHCVSEEPDAETDGGELDLSGIDDKEIELYLLSDREIQVKTALWMAENSDYLKEQRAKEAKIAKEKELGIYKEKKKRSSSGRRKGAITASSTGEAIGKMLEVKKISSKINYDILKDLNVTPAASPGKVKEEAPKTPKLTPRARRPAGANALTLSTPLSTLGKRYDCTGRGGGGGGGRGGGGGGGRGGGEAERPGAEAERPGAEAERPGAEAERPGAEAERPGAEAERPGAEAERPGAEAERPGAEAERPGAEAERPGAEAERPGAEAERPGAEAERPGAEAERPGAEAERPGEAERPEERPGAEAERPGAEAERPGAEAERPGAEAERPGAERPGAERPGAERPGAERPGAERPGAERPGAERPRHGGLSV
uniref:Cyclin-like domain-containing protein n=1 Tax=Knipowitschia caucasica TaxID=637954 RepID=A0AAV2JFN3_KNICA